MSQRPVPARLAGLAALLLAFPPVGAADDPAAIATAKAFVTGDTQALAGGDPVRLFIVSQVRTQNVYRLGGLQLESVRIDHRLIFLPRGALFASDAGRWAVGHWRSAPGGFEVTLPGGKTTALHLGRAQSGPDTVATVTGFGLTYWEVARPTDASLPGRYETLNAAYSGGGPLLSVSSSGHKALTLSPNHRFEISAAGSASAVGRHTVTAASNSSTVRGTWRYEPASYTLILEPEGGKPALKGPFFPSAPGAQRQGSSTAWSVLGDNSWWRVNR